MPQIYEKSIENQFRYPPNHPVVSLIYLLLLMFVGAILFGIAGILIVLAQGGDIDDLRLLLAGGSPAQINSLRIVQTASSFGTFVIPAVIMAKIERQRTRYFKFSLNGTWQVWLMAVFIMFAAAPLLEISGSINHQLNLPDFLSGLERWMLQKEADLEKLTKIMLTGIRTSDLMFNIFMVAILPAIGEELVFRGILQNILIRWTSNGHLGVWLAAIIFSTIHFQFYGFLPRMIMGALFGYLFLWSRNLWLPILAHFINNASVVVYAFILQRQGKTLDLLNEHEFLNPGWYFLSFLATTGILYYFWRNSKEEST